jgi:hypothetical protein
VQLLLFAQFEDLLAFGLGESSPDTVGLAYRQRVPAALYEHRAALADRLGPGLSVRSGWAAFAVGVEEEAGVHPPTSATELPVPEVRVRSGKSPGIGHRDRLLIGFFVACHADGRSGEAPVRAARRAQPAGRWPCNRDYPELQGAKRSFGWEDAAAYPVLVAPPRTARRGGFGTASGWFGAGAWTHRRWPVTSGAGGLAARDEPGWCGRRGRVRTPWASPGCVGRRGRVRPLASVVL